MTEESKDDNVYVVGMGKMTTEQAAHFLQMESTAGWEIEFLSDLQNLQYLRFDKFSYGLPVLKLTANPLEGKLDGFGIRGSPPKTFPGTYQLYPKKIIDGGPDGLIVRYRILDTAVVWTIKIELLKVTQDSSGANVIQDSSETSVINHLTTNKIQCGQIYAYPIGKTKIVEILNIRKEIWVNFSRLETMQGDLSQKDAAGGLEVISLAKRNYNGPEKTEDLKAVEAALCIVEEVRRQIVCLLKSTNYEGVYADLKAANVLFKQTVENQLEVKVGDLGSINPIYNFDDLNIGVHDLGVPLRTGGIYTATAPCYPRNQQGNTVTLTTDEQKEQCLAWQLGVLMAQLLGINVQQLYYGHDQLVSTVGVIQEQIIKKIQAALPENLQGIIIPAEYAAYLNLNPDKRPSVLYPLPKLTDGACNNYVRMSNLPAPAPRHDGIGRGWAMTHHGVLYER